MPEPITEVFGVYNRAGELVMLKPYDCTDNGWPEGYTVQRLPLATPEMMADKERFDWLADQGQNWHEPKYNDRGNYCGHGGFSRRIWSVESDSQTASLREAIDAARAAGGAHEPHG